MNAYCSCGERQVVCNFGYLITRPWGVLKASQLILAFAALISICSLPAFSGTSGAASFLLTVLIIAVIVTTMSILVNSLYLPQKLPAVPFGFAELTYCILLCMFCFIGSFVSFWNALRKSGTVSTCFAFTTIFMTAMFGVYVANSYLILRQWQGTSWMSLIEVKGDEPVLEKGRNGSARSSTRSYGNRAFSCTSHTPGVQTHPTASSSYTGIVVQVPPTVLPPLSTVTIVPPTSHSESHQVDSDGNNSDGSNSDEDSEETESMAPSNDQPGYSFDVAVRKFDEL